MNTETFNLVKCPAREERSKAPHYESIPRRTFHGLTHPDNDKYEREKDFDHRVFKAMLVDGLGKEPTSTCGGDMLCLIVGAIRLIGHNEGVDPSSFRLSRPMDAIYGMWSLAYESLLATDKICVSIRHSLERLLVPTTNPAENDADSSEHTNMALQDFWDGPWGEWYRRNYYTARQQSSRLSSELQAMGSGLEDFSPEERESLQLLISGVTRMQPIVEESLK